jgi:hypothetical protein
MREWVPFGHHCLPESPWSFCQDSPGLCSVWAPCVCQEEARGSRILAVWPHGCLNCLALETLKTNHNPCGATEAKQGLQRSVWLWPYSSTRIGRGFA